MSTLSGGPNIVTTGLVLNLDAANTKSYVSGSTIWNDISQGGNNGTLVNGPTFNSANGGSIVFAGTNDYVSNTYLGTAISDYTFSVWFKNDNYSEAKYTINRGRDGAGNGWSLTLYVNTTGIASAGAVPTIPSTVGIVANGVSTLALNTWYYITGVWTAGSSVKVYVNGTLEGTTNTAGTSLRTSTNNWVLGSVSTTIYTSGYTAIAQIYNRALSAQEILQNFNATRTRFGL
jgi:hypothetical protein